MTLLISCTVTPDSGSTPSFPNHRWSEAQIRQLNNLSLYSLEARPDPSNKYVNNDAAIALGHMIFFDARFSRYGDIACASCHKPELYFTDGLATAQGIGKTRRNTPTLVGASRHTWFFWDGRSDSLWSQALGPLEHELEHGGTRNQYAHIVYHDPKLRSRYEILFGKMPDLSHSNRFPKDAGPVNDKIAHESWREMNNHDQETITRIFVNIGKAIAAYVTQLQPAPSRFDRYAKAASSNDLAAMQSLLSDEEAAGLKLFIGKANCTMCHNGPMFTDYGFHNIATPAAPGESYDWGRFSGAKEVLASPFNCRSRYNDNEEKTCDELRYIATDKHETLGSIKTPGLRNVAKIAPYMHAGQFKTLKEVIKHYADPPPLDYRRSDLLEIDLSKMEIRQIEAFLLTLNSDIDTPTELLTAP